MTNIGKNILLIREKISAYETRYHRKKNAVSLLAVSKHQSIEKISAAIDAGLVSFGENYLQEALPKIEFFANEKLSWHFIGPIQNNKTKKIAEHFDWVHTLCDHKTAERLNNQRPNNLPPLNICIQVNVSEEQTKSGISDKALLSLATFCSTLPRLTLRGLMTIPAPKDNLTEQCAQLHVLRTAYDKLISLGFPLDTLSMGMSDDLEAAIAEGATVVRIGTAIFGSRT